MQKIEEIALSKLIRDDNYCRSVLPFLKDEYFDNQPHQVLFHEINDYVTEYNQIPETTALKIEIEKRRDLSAEIIKDIEDFLDTRLMTPPIMKSGCMRPQKSGVKNVLYILP